MNETTDRKRNIESFMEWKDSLISVRIIPKIAARINQSTAYNAHFKDRFWN